MNLKEIRDEAWALARVSSGNDANKLWNEAEMNRYINRVYRYIARETKCIRDAITPSVCRISVAPPADLSALQALAATDTFAADDLVEYGTIGSWLEGKLVAPRVFPLHELILEIEEVKWKGVPWKLAKSSVSKWQINPYWEKVCAYPTEYCTDYSTGYIALNYRSTASDTLLMIVKRMPLTPLSSNTDVPELRVNYHDYFINGILEQMYSKQDAEAIDLKKAADYKTSFLRDVDDIKQQEAILDQRLKVNFSQEAFR